MTKEAMKLALEALKRMKCYGDTFAYRRYEQNPHEQVCEAITALEALAEQPTQQEPVAWMWVVDGKPKTVSFGGANSNTPKEWAVLPLYTTPPAQRTWVGLTDVEWMNIVNKDQAWFGQRPDEVAHEVAKLIEARLKEKNNV